MFENHIERWVKKYCKASGAAILSLEKKMGVFITKTKIWIAVIDGDDVVCLRITYPFGPFTNLEDLPNGLSTGMMILSESTLLTNMPISVFIRKGEAGYVYMETSNIKRNIINDENFHEVIGVFEKNLKLYSAFI